MPGTDADSKLSFRYGELAGRIRTRIDRHFDAPAYASDPSLVVGIFGEWGAGKSTLLREVGEIKSSVARKDLSTTVVVPFNPWRYEKETHLIVPLLKVTESALKTREQALEGETDAASKKAVGIIKKASRYSAIAALSFASMFKTKVGIPGLGDVSIDPKAAIDQAKAILKDSEQEVETSTALTELESHYFSFEQALGQITRGDPQAELNLLFLVDDLDRCLPEKAVEMLESIKLFLDVKGFAFVVALDDEVVERGVQHRYRDYLFNQHNETLQTPGDDNRPPITGAEYLEKIIHLPFRLPAPTRQDMRAFLLQFPFFKADPSGPQNQDENHEERQDAEKASSRKEKPQPHTEVLECFLAAIPPVPRKMVRALELFELLLETAKERKLEDFSELTLARLTLLQLFAPGLYRYSRRHAQNSLHFMEEWKAEYPDVYLRNDFGEWLGSLLKKGEDLDGNKTGEPADQARINTYDRVWLPLLKHIREVRNSRSGFEPFDLLLDGQACDKKISRYYSLSEAPKPSKPAPLGIQEARPVASLGDTQEFLDELFSGSDASVQSALSRDELSGHVLSEKDFQALLERLQNPSYQDFVLDLDWLEAITAIMSAEQITSLYQRTGLLQRLSAKASGDQA